MLLLCHKIHFFLFLWYLLSVNVLKHIWQTNFVFWSSLINWPMNSFNSESTCLSRFFQGHFEVDPSETQPSFVMFSQSFCNSLMHLCDLYCLWLTAISFKYCYMELISTKHSEISSRNFEAFTSRSAFSALLRCLYHVQIYNYTILCYLLG